jgi:polysaccharide deacetylase family protein (PEP-CTERM system associated)
VPGLTPMYTVHPLELTCGNSVLSIDVEDWFHIMDLPSAPRIDKWSGLPSLVEPNFLDMLDMLDRRGVKGTCFFLGWVAERLPHLVSEAKSRGHEIASHGYTHDLVYELTDRQFLADVIRARKLLEDLSGGPVAGYRAPGFSVTEKTPWFFERLAEAGYRYDSSVFPASRGHGGFASFGIGPCIVDTKHGPIVEIPVSVARFLGARVCFFGGGYLRLFPYTLVRRMAAQVLAEGRPVVFYVHPREIDPGHPRLEMPLGRRFRSYVGLKRARRKIDNVLRDFSFQPFSTLLQGVL